MGRDAVCLGGDRAEFGFARIRRRPNRFELAHQRRDKGRSAVWIYTGRRGADLDRTLACAETDNGFFDCAFALLGRLDPITNARS